jgi:hypothetical protein
MSAPAQAIAEPCHSLPVAARDGERLLGSSQTNRRGTAPSPRRFSFGAMSTKRPHHAYQYPVLPCRFGVGAPVGSASADAGNFHRGNGAADIGAEWRKPGRAAIAIAGRSRLLDAGENAGGQAGDADAAGNAAERLLDIWPEWSARRCVWPGATGSAHSRQPVSGLGYDREDAANRLHS